MGPLAVALLTVLLCQMGGVVAGYPPDLASAATQFFVALIVAALILSPRRAPRG